MIKKSFKAHGVYVHVPFCKRKCLYCDFFSCASDNTELMLQYADAVCCQIEQTRAEVTDYATIYFGGGTPSILPVDGLIRIVEKLKQCGFWQMPKEATIECNPGTVDLDKLQVYRQLGFDRISFGVQSFNNNELRVIGRIHNADDALTAVALAKAAGFKRINVDLIYGLPLQNLNSLQYSLQQFCSLNLSHLSLYSLILEDGTSLKTMVDNGQIKMPDENLTADMDDWVQKFLLQHGYKRYEISNYAKTGEESKHNLVYWNYLPYIGLGAGATGFDGWTRYKGVENIGQYIRSPLAVEKEHLTCDNIYSEFMFMNLRKADGVRLKEYKERYGEDITDKTLTKINTCIEDGVVEYDDKKDVLRLTERGMSLGNLVFSKFV